MAKYRNGFVSNSSSSSFLVIFPEEITDVKQLEGKIFGRREFEQTVFADIKNQKPIKVDPTSNKTRKLLEDFFDDGYSISYAIVDRILKQIKPGNVAYIFEYSDNDGKYFSEMEHSEIFRDFPYIRISHH